MSAKPRTRLGTLLIASTLLAIPAVYYGCGGKSQGDSVGIAIPPDVLANDANQTGFTLAVRFLRPDIINVTEADPNNPGLRFGRLSNLNGPALQVEIPVGPDYV